MAGADGIADARPGSWTCAEAVEMQCPGIDELPTDFGCQVSCHKESARDGRCIRAQRKCGALPACKSINVNDEGTWATLKQHILQRGNHTASGDGATADAFCAPILKDRGERRRTAAAASAAREAC